LLAVSLIGLSLVPLILSNSNLQADLSPIRRPLVGAVYSVICIVGIIAVFYPGKCRIMFQKPNVSADSTKLSATVQFKGHHPDCEKFWPNRIKIRGSTFCAACSGLLMGAIGALVVIVLFSLGLFGFGSLSVWVLRIGEFLMLAGLAQVKMKGFVKMSINALFVVGSSLSLVAADLAGQSLLVDSYVLGLIVFMLWFRILLSEWNNKKTCVACGHCI
jgi:hypothetical protein